MVIAIIAILIALLLPVLKRLRQSAMNQTCKNNLRQIGYGIRMYTDDNRGRFPDPHSLGGSRYRRLVGERDPDDPASLPETYGWSALLHQGGYLKVNSSSTVWRCPAAVDILQTYKNTYWGWTMVGGPGGKGGGRIMGTVPQPSADVRRRLFLVIADNLLYAPAKPGVMSPLSYPPGNDYAGDWMFGGSTENYLPFDLPGPHRYSLDKAAPISPTMGFPKEITSLPVTGYYHVLTPDLRIAIYRTYQSVTWDNGGGGAGADLVEEIQ